MRKKYLFTTTILISILGLWGFILYKYFELKGEESYHGSVINEKASDFTLTSQNGKSVTLSQFEGKVVIISFGYTHCPDICPMTLTILKDVMKKLLDAENKLQVLFVTVDPERDTPKRLKDYIPYFDKNFLGLTGTSQEIAKVAESYHISYFKDDTNSKAGYLMAHSSSVYVIDPKGNLFLEYSSNDLDPELIAEDVRRIL